MSSADTRPPIHYKWPFEKEAGSEISVDLWRGATPAQDTYVGYGPRQYPTADRNHRSEVSVKLKSPVYGSRSPLGSGLHPVKTFSVDLSTTHGQIEPHTLEFNYNPMVGSYCHDMPTRSVTGIGKKFGDGKLDAPVRAPLTQEYHLEMGERLILDDKTADDCLKRDAARSTTDIHTRLGHSGRLSALSATANAFVPTFAAPTAGSSPGSFRHGQQLTLDLAPRLVFSQHLPPLYCTGHLRREAEEFTDVVYSRKSTALKTDPVNVQATLTIAGDVVQQALPLLYPSLSHLSKASGLKIDNTCSEPSAVPPQGDTALSALKYDEKLGLFAHSMEYGTCRASAMGEGGRIPIQAKLKVDWTVNPDDYPTLQMQASRNEPLTLSRDDLGNFQRLG